MPSGGADRRRPAVCKCQAQALLSYMTSGPTGMCIVTGRSRGGKKEQWTVETSASPGQIRRSRAKEIPPAPMVLFSTIRTHWGFFPARQGSGFLSSLFLHSHLSLDPTKLITSKSLKRIKSILTLSRLDRHWELS